MRLIAVVAALAAAASGGAANAYKIYLPRVHEALTLAAQYCASDALAAGKLPEDCRRYREQVPVYAQPQWALTALQREVRWPDDPRREMKSVGVARAAMNAKLKGCERKLRRSRAVQHVGTFCSSHFGEWQFLHAMSVARPDGRGGSEVEDAATTRVKILEWAGFAYDVARGDVKAMDNYCDVLASRGAIAGVMVPEGFALCSGRSPWTVGTFFSVRCGQLLFFGWCRPLVPAPEFVKTVATGALLHLIQDSYSQSHVRRAAQLTWAEPGKLAPVVHCGKPQEYFVYDEKNRETHDDADQVPSWDDDCATGRQADDAITASAMALAYLQEGKSREAFTRYLDDRVF